MKECLCLCVFSGNRPATVCVFGVLLCVCGGVCMHVCRTTKG